MSTGDHVRSYYGVPAHKGGRIRYSGDAVIGKRPRLGTIVGFDGAYLRILFDDDPHKRLLHPTWMVEYLEDSHV